MNIRVENNLFKVDGIPPIFAGGEGEIYSLPSQMMLKLYHDNVLTPVRQQKVLELCTRYETFRGIFDLNQYAFPQISAIA